MIKIQHPDIYDKYDCGDWEVTAIYCLDEWEISDNKWKLWSQSPSKYTLARAREELEIWVGHIEVKNKITLESFENLLFEDLGSVIYGINEIRSRDIDQFTIDFDVGTGGVTFFKNELGSISLTFFELVGTKTRLTVSNIDQVKIINLVDRFYRRIHQKAWEVFDKL